MQFLHSEVTSYIRSPIRVIALHGDGRVKNIWRIKIDGN